MTAEIPLKTHQLVNHIKAGWECFPARQALRIRSYPERKIEKLRNVYFAAIDFFFKFNRDRLRQRSQKFC